MLRNRFPPYAYFVLALACLGAVVPFFEAIARLFDIWNLRPEYSHCILIPLMSLFLIWRQRDELRGIPMQGSWWGVAFLLAGYGFWLVGELATVWVLVQYGFVLVIYGLVLAVFGRRLFRQLLTPLLLLIFMIPLPAFFNNSLSLSLQLISSAIGVAIIQLWGISVHLQGNVIDLGVYQLQVAEACDGLRYLFPLMTLAFVMAYLFRAPMWKRVALFVASVPIAVLMNSLRIGVIGITVEYWGPRMAEGMLHEFQGWLVFMCSVALLLLFAIALNRFGRSQLNWRQALNLDLPDVAPRTSDVRHAQPLRMSVSFGAAGAALAMPERNDVPPTREQFVYYPSQIGAWQGQSESMEKVYLDALQLDDYLFSNYQRTGAAPVNLYMAYYASQRRGQSVHSPRACIPGGGWTITRFEQVRIPLGSGESVPANRVEVELGKNKQIIYYWFQQRGRRVTNEYLVKWYIFWDALRSDRTDGALVRLSSPLLPGRSVAMLDRDLTQFAATVVPTLSRYVPD
jgi:exosortase D (VPLPA-CTERM-specific)